MLTGLLGVFCINARYFLSSNNNSTLLNLHSPKLVWGTHPNLCNGNQFLILVPSHPKISLTIHACSSIKLIGLSFSTSLQIPHLSRTLQPICSSEFIYQLHCRCSRSIRSSLLRNSQAIKFLDGSQKSTQPKSYRIYKSSLTQINFINCEKAHAEAKLWSVPLRNGPEALLWWA